MSADVDIDLADRNQLLQLISAVPARQDASGRKHNSGVYVTPVPVDPFNDCASIDYHEAEQRGYFKIDLLNQSVYTLIESPEHYEKMLAHEPNWSLLEDPAFCERVVHISNYHNLIMSMRPDSIPRMAMLLSIIRPAKAHLQNKPWDEVAQTVWQKPVGDEYYFKKAHAVGYAKLVALHINLLDENIR